MGAVYATTAELEAGWRPLDDAERARAGVLLRRASALVRAECPTVDARLADGSLDPEVVAMVVCAMVQRVLSAPSVDLEGASQYSESSGPYSESVTFSNPAGNFWLTKQERKWLGCGAAQAFTIDLAPDMRPYPVHDFGEVSYWPGV